MGMVETILKTLMESFLENLPEDQVKAAADAALDKLEKMVEDSSNKIDDALVLPLINKCIREPFGIEDNDEPKVETPAEDNNGGGDTPPAE